MVRRGAGMRGYRVQQQARGARRLARRRTVVVLVLAVAAPLMWVAAPGTSGAAIAKADAKDAAACPTHPKEQSSPGEARGHDKKQACPANSGAGAARGDFNHDGFADLAVGVPLDDVGAA